MKEGTWVEDSEGKEIWMPYDDFDPEQLPKLIRPKAGFVFEAGGFMHLPLPSVPFYIKDWLPKQGRLEIYGWPKAGKSFMCIQLARCIAGEIPFLEQPTQSGRVLYVQSELGAEVLQMRLLSTGHSYRDVWVGTTFSMKIDTPSGQRMLGSALNAVQPQVLILDPLYKQMNGDENEAGEVRKITDFLDDMIEAYGMSVVLIHHAGKDLARGGRGSNALEAWVDSYLEIKRISKNGEPLRVRLTPKNLRHAELPPEPIEAELEGFEFVRREGKGTVYDLVVTHFEENPDVVITPKMLEEADIGSHKSIADALARAVVDKKVRKLARGEYMYTGEEQDERTN